MSGKLKAFGLALLAAFALSAVAATGAQAENEQTAKFTASEFPAVFTGHEEGAVNEFNITGGADKFTCANVTYEGTLKEASSEITVTPHYTNCQNGDGLTVHVDLNGCDYLFTAKTATPAQNDAHGEVHIKCPPNQSITLTATAFGAVVCTVHIKEQSVGGKAGEVTYTNKAGEGAGKPTPKDYVTVDVAVKGIHYVETKNSFVCPFENNFTGQDGGFNSQVIIKGFKDLGTHEDPNTPGTNTYTEGEELPIHVK